MSVIKFLSRIAPVLLSLGLLLSACNPASFEPEPSPTPAAITRPATVEQVETILLESFPVRVHAIVRGQLGDGCTTIGEISQARDGNTFQIAITTTRPAEAACTLALVPFEETVPLDVAGLPAGSYMVEANGASASFELSVDNALPGAPGAETGLAPVETVSVRVLESFPVQVHVAVTGYLPDGCTQIGAISQAREANTFTVRITSQRPADLACAAVIVPFEQTIPLDVADLPAGAYVVDVNGVTGSFDLAVDN